MTVHTFSWMSAPDAASDATFRKWAQGIHDALDACGWVQTADTGQINLSEATAPGANHTAAGYEVWALDDALQATAPIYLKIEYGRGGAATTPSLWVTVARSTNGAGTLSGTLLERVQTHGGGQQVGSTSEYASYASGDGSSLCLVLWPALTNSNVTTCLVIERSRDLSGDPDGDAVMIALSPTWPVSLSGGTPTSHVRVIGYDGSVSSRCSQHDRLPVSFPGVVNNVARSVSSSLSEDGVTAPVLPVPCMAPGVTPWVSNVVVAVHPGDAGTTSVIQAATINGETRMYRAFPYWIGSTVSGIGKGPGLLAICTGESDTSQRWFLPAIAWAVE